MPCARRLLILAVQVAATTTLVGAAPSVANAQTVRPCLPPDSTAAALKRLATAIFSDTTYFARSVRKDVGMLAGPAEEVTVVQDDAICESATAGVEKEGGRRIPHALVVARMGHASPFYLLTRRRDGVMGSLYLMNTQFVLLALLGDG
jgi:hypothetical protein